MTGELVIDVLLLLVLLAYAVSGWRQGLVGAVLGLVGLLAGAWAALRFGPDVIEQATDLDVGSSGGVLLLVLVLLVGATVGQALMLAVAGRLREGIRASRFGVLDRLLGAVAVVTAAVLVLWVVAGAVRTNGPAGLRTAVARSTVVQAVDVVVPQSASRLVDDVTRALDRGGFPRVFEGLGPEPIASVPSPDDALTSDPDVRQALASVIHVQADARRCDQTQVGSGWVLSRDRVVTNAHVVAGASRVQVSVDDTGPDVAARVVAFDSDRDIAVLDAPGLGAAVLDLGDPLGSGDDAVVAGFPGDVGLRALPARVRDVLDARGADIYGEPGTTRSIYSLRAQIRQGASGGPMLDAAGDVVGMVFATSLDDPETGYALTLEEMEPVLQGVAGSSDTVSTGRCTSH